MCRITNKPALTNRQKWSILVKQIAFTGRAQDVKGFAVRHAAGLLRGVSDTPPVPHDRAILLCGSLSGGDPSVAMGCYAAVLHALNYMDKDLLLVAKDDELGRKLQDLELATKKYVK